MARLSGLPTRLANLPTLIRANQQVRSLLLNFLLGERNGRQRICLPTLIDFGPFPRYRHWARVAIGRPRKSATSPGAR